jgi:hypothetical protein
MNERQAYALTHPATDPREALNPKLSAVRKHPRGFLLRSILAVDR